MPMKVEAAIVTQKRPSAVFNTDSVNINGKVFSREILKNGYKGSGVLSGNAFFALASSDIDGFADAAVTAFNDRSEKFSVARDPRSVFSGYYEDCRSALFKMGKNENDLVSSCLFASGRRVVLSVNGNAAIYACNNGGCWAVNTVKAEDTVADYNSAVFSDVAEGDIFILLSNGISEVLSQKDIEDTIRVSDGSVKRIVSLISKVALAREGSGAVSIIAVKILETAVEEAVPDNGFTPDFSHLENERKDEETSEVENGAEVTENSAEDSAEGVTAGNNEAEAEGKRDITDIIAENARELYTEYAQDIGSDTVAETASAASDEASEDEETAFEPQLSAEEEAEKRRIKSRLKLLIALSALLLLSIAMFVTILATRGFSGIFPESTTVAETTLEETTAEESTSEDATAEEDTEEATDENASEETTGEEETTDDAETTEEAEITEEEGTQTEENTNFSVG